MHIHIQSPELLNRPRDQPLLVFLFRYIDLEELCSASILGNQIVRSDIPLHRHLLARILSQVAADDCCPFLGEFQGYGATDSTG
jgi:hypothetical protein